MLKNKTVATFLVTGILAGTFTNLPTNVLAAELPKDMKLIKTEEAKKAVQYLYESDRLTGYADGNFKPGAAITRAEFVTMVLRNLELPVKENTENVTFKDSKVGNWYHDNLTKAYVHGLLSGTGKTKDGLVILSPNDKITREEMVTILIRAHESQFGKNAITTEEVTTILSAFGDKDKLPSWSKTAVAKAVKAGITTGVKVNEFGAGDEGTRIQSAIFSYRLLKQIEDKVIEDEVTEDETPGETLLADVVYLKDSLQTVADAKKVTAERFKLTEDKVSFVQGQVLDDGAEVPVDTKIKDVEKVFVVLNHGVKADETSVFQEKTIYKILVNESNVSISIDPVNKVVNVNEENTLKEVKNAFEVTSADVIGENKVDFYSEFNSDVTVNGSMTVLLSGDNGKVTSIIEKLSFADSLGVERNKNSLVVKGLELEDMLDLYKLNEVSGDWEKVSDKSNVEVNSTGKYEYVGLSLGKYKVVQQPLELKEEPEVYAIEYNKRIVNENVHEIVPYIVAEPTGTKIRLDSNYDLFGFESTDETKNFFKDAGIIGKITGSGELVATINYDVKTDHEKMTSFIARFSTEDVDVDDEISTPDVTFQTIELIGEADFTKFALGEKFSFTLMLEDTLEDGNVASKTEVKYEVTVVLGSDGKTLELEYLVK